MPGPRDVADKMPRQRGIFRSVARSNGGRSGGRAPVEHPALGPDSPVSSVFTGVEPAGIEPATSCLQSRRSPN